MHSNLVIQVNLVGTTPGTLQKARTPKWGGEKNKMIKIVSSDCVDREFLVS